MDTIKLTKDQLEQITSHLRAIDSAERNSDSMFVRRFFEELVNTKIVNFGVIVASNRLTENVLTDLQNTYLWLKHGKDAFKEKTDNTALEYITDRMYNLLIVCDPKRFTPASKKKGSGKFRREDMIFRPVARATDDAFNEGEIFRYGGTVYLVLEDNTGGPRLSIASINANGDPAEHPTVTTSRSTIMDVRRGAYMLVNYPEPEPQEVAVNDPVIGNPIINGRFQYTFAGSIDDHPRIGYSRVGADFILGSASPSEVRYDGAGGVRISYDNTTYELVSTSVVDQRLMFVCRRIIGGGGVAIINVTANFFRRNNGVGFQRFINWYKRFVGPAYDILDPTIGAIEARFGNRNHMEEIA